MLIPFLLFLLIPALLWSIALLFLFLYIALYRAPCITRRTSLGRSAVVVVLGDVGRSPRMCYHVESLADQGWKVSVVGYGGSKLPTSIQRSSVRFLRLEEFPHWISQLPRLAFIVVAPFKLLWQSTTLFWKVAMVVQPPPEVIIVQVSIDFIRRVRNSKHSRVCLRAQTPPALPTLFVVRLCSLLLSSRVIIDWHNLAYSILALRLGGDSPLVRLAAYLERVTGRYAFAHLFVTHAMRQHLETQWKLVGHKAVLHDRPPKHFKKASIRDAHALWSTLAPRLTPNLDDWWPEWEPGLSTPFTKRDISQPAHFSARTDRPALVVSSTSWTADEDFSLLLRSAQMYEKRAQEVNAISSRQTSLSANSVSCGGRSSPSVLDGPLSVQQQRASRQNTRPNSSDFSPSYHGVASVSPSPPRRSSGSGPATLSVAQTTCSSPERPSSPSPDPVGVPSSPRSHRRRRYSVMSHNSPTQLPHLPAKKLPKLLIVVTGKGELKAKYEAEIRRLEQQEAWKYVRIRTAWLENSEYPVLLGAADLGVSLHTSSSGLDLPMKVVDMLGCHLPVLALDFSCLDELVQHGKNGLTFRNDMDLCECLESLLADFPYLTSQSSSESTSNLDGSTAKGRGANWLVQNGGLREPFVFAGQAKLLSAGPITAQAVHASVYPRQSLEANAGLEESEERKLLSRRSLEFSKGGLPTTNSFGSLSGTSSPSTSFWKLGGSSSGDGAAFVPPRPTTPTPSFTMLASPVLGEPLGGVFSAAMDNETEPPTCGQSSQSTWSATWKAQVRPLLRLADEEDAEKEGSSLEREEKDLIVIESEKTGGLWSTTAENIPMDNAWNLRTPSQTTRRQVGANGKPLRVRGGSVHGLLWSEDFASSDGAFAATSGGDGDGTYDDDGDDEFPSDLLSTLGLVVTGSPTLKRKPSIQRGDIGLTSAPSTPRAKLRGLTVFRTPDKDKSGQPLSNKKFEDHSEVTPGEPLGISGISATSSLEGSSFRRQHLRHRTAKGDFEVFREGAASTIGSSASREVIPDIRVSDAEGEGHG